MAMPPKPVPPPVVAGVFDLCRTHPGNGLFALAFAKETAWLYHRIRTQAKRRPLMERAGRSGLLRPRKARPAFTPKAGWIMLANVTCVLPKRAKPGSKAARI